MKLFKDIKEKKAIRKLFIKNTLFVYLPVFALFIILFIVIYSIQINNAREKEKIVFQNKTWQKLSVITKNLSDIDKQINEFEKNENFKRFYLTKDLFSDMKAFRILVQKFNELANPFMISNSHINSIGIYSLNANFFLYSKNFPYQEYSDELTNKIGDALKNNNSQRSYLVFTNSDMKILSVVHKVNVDFIYSGIVIFNLYLDDMLKLLDEDITEADYLSIRDKQGNTIIEKGQMVKAKNSFKDSIEVNVELQNGYEATVIINKIKDIKTENIFTMQIVFLLVLSLIVVAVITFFISVRMYMPLKQIISICESESDSIDSNKIKVSNEYDFIINNISSAYKTKFLLEKQLLDKLTSLKKMQAIALQSQINPHFLSNTLQIIGLYAEEISDEDNKVTFMISELSKMLKYTLATSEHLTTIRQEIDYIKMYINIQKERYKDKFDVIFNIPDEILNEKIVKITFQPLVENAIYHGIRPVATKCNIHIIGEVYNDYIIFKVINEGIRLTKTQIIEINDFISTDKISEDAHIGLSNVNHRIKIIFGNDYGLSIGSNLDGNTVVFVKIPHHNVSFVK